MLLALTPSLLHIFFLFWSLMSQWIDKAPPAPIVPANHCQRPPLAIRLAHHRFVAKELPWITPRFFWCFNTRAGSKHHEL